MFRSSHPQVFCKKGVLRNFAKFTGKHLCQGLFFNKYPDACNFIKKKTLVQVSSCEFCEISKNAFIHTEADVQRCSVKKVFLETSQNSQENACVRVSFLIKLQA